MAEAENFEKPEIGLAERSNRSRWRLQERSRLTWRNLIVNAIAAVGLMTLNQVGLEAFVAADAEVEPPKGLMKKSPDTIVNERAKDDSQGMLGFLKTIDKRYSVIYSNGRLQGKFQIMSDQQIAASHCRHIAELERTGRRCWEGVVPVECLSASCGTCWVGVLGGQEKLSEVQRLERRSMKVFGYNQPEDEKPYLRLACQPRRSATQPSSSRPGTAFSAKRSMETSRNWNWNP